MWMSFHRKGGSQNDDLAVSSSHLYVTFYLAETGYLGLAQSPLGSSFHSQFYELGLLPLAITVTWTGMLDLFL